MKLSGQVLLELHQAAAAALKAGSTVSQETAGSLAMLVCKAISDHPNLKVSRVGVRPPKAAPVQSVALTPVVKL